MTRRAISARPYEKKRKRKKEKTGDVPALGNGGAGDAVPAARVKKLSAGVRIVDEDVDDWKYAREREEEAKLKDEETPVVVGEDGKAAAAERAEEKRRQYLGMAGQLLLTTSQDGKELKKRGFKMR